jgi:hypothetical protein
METKLRIGLGLIPGESRSLLWTPNSKEHADWTPGGTGGVVGFRPVEEERVDWTPTGGQGSWWTGLQIGDGAGGLDSRSVMEFG